MNPSPDQVNSAVRILVASGFSLLAGWAIGKGLITKDQAAAILSDQQLMGAGTVIVLSIVGAAGSAFSLVWGLVAHKQVNLVATVAAMPEVAKVETMPTEAGAALAESVPPAPGSVVTVAGH